MAQTHQDILTLLEGTPGHVAAFIAAAENLPGASVEHEFFAGVDAERNPSGTTTNRSHTSYYMLSGDAMVNPLLVATKWFWYDNDDVLTNVQTTMSATPPA